jgi:hypothetical protein
MSRYCSWESDDEGRRHLSDATETLAIVILTPKDPSAPNRSQRTFVLRDRSRAILETFGDWPASRRDSLERKLPRFGSGNAVAMYAPPEARHLLGADARSVATNAAKDVQIAIRDLQRFAAVALKRNPLPLYVRGVLTTTKPEPLDVAVAVNGVVAAVTISYRERGAHVFGTLIPESALRDGNNTVAAFVVDALPSPKLPN